MYCRVIGAIIIAIGLYMVLWGKSKDQIPAEDCRFDPTHEQVMSPNTQRLETSSIV